MDDAEISEEAAYNRLSCRFFDPLYPGNCRGIAIESGAAAITARGPHSKNQGGPVILRDVSRIVMEADFPEGRRLVEVYADSANVKCSKKPAQGKLILSYTRAVIESDESRMMRGRFDPKNCRLSDPLL